MAAILQLEGEHPHDEGGPLVLLEVEHPHDEGGPLLLLNSEFLTPQQLMKD